MHIASFCKAARENNGEKENAALELSVVLSRYVPPGGKRHSTSIESNDVFESCKNGKVKPGTNSAVRPFQF